MRREIFRSVLSVLNCSRHHWVYGMMLAGLLLLNRSLDALPHLDPIEIPPLTSWTNSLEMSFVVGLKAGVKFACWETRVKDYEAYTKSRFLPKKTAGFAQTGEHPVVGVSWQEAKEFCQWLTERERRRGVIPRSAFYRLPTDQEWTSFLGIIEEADGSPRELDEQHDGVHLWGGQWPPKKGVGNYGPDLGVDSFPETAPVGSFEPTPVGLYDVGGNVWEWCEDWYDENQVFRVLRGASWRTETYRNHLATERHAHLPDAQVDCYGFRCVLEDLALSEGR